jgi:fructose-bisphosphate aldolase, class I
MARNDLGAIAQAMVATGKGILAADESTGTIGKRFDSIQVENNEIERRNYRDLLFQTKALNSYISGVILYDETLRQRSADGTSFVDLLSRQGILPGIKVDMGAKNLALCPGETITEGLDNLAIRCDEYVQFGAKFAKWRAVIDIAKNIPSATCVVANAHALARYAAICQQSGLVPIVEPEVLMDGDHDIDRCEEVTEATLSAVYDALRIHKVVLEHTVLKPSMVISGKKCAKQANVAEVAERTVRILKRTVPAAVAGVVFLSGGQSDTLATEHLNAMNQLGPFPWPVSFSYGRALQQAALKAWHGKPENVTTAQAALAHRSHMNSLASIGQYQSSLEK